MGYKIESGIPLPAEAPGFKVSKAVESLRKLKVGESFLVPASELMVEGTKWATTSAGQRISNAARRMGIRVNTEKQTGGDAPGLRVWRIE